MTLQGEYWFDESGTSMYADGDIGEVNHEGHVMQQMQSQYTPDQFNKYGDPDWEGYQEHLYQQALQQATQNKTPQQAQIAQTQLDNGWNKKLHDILKQTGMTDEQIEIANGRGDSRLYAIKNWKWKRVKEDTIETWTITAKDLQSIANGLWDAYDEDARQATYEIYVVSNRKHFKNVPYEVIESEDPTALTQYQNKFETFQHWLHNRIVKKLNE